MPIYYRDGYNGQLAVDAKFTVPEELRPDEVIDTQFIRLAPTGLLTVKSGYAWDYASVPITHKFSNWFMGKKTKSPSLVHDAFCQLHRNGYLEDIPDARKHADRYFYDLLLKNKMWKPRAWIWYKGVRIGSKNAQKPKPILEAP